MGVNGAAGARTPGAVVDNERFNAAGARLRVKSGLTEASLGPPLDASRSGFAGAILNTASERPNKQSMEAKTRRRLKKRDIESGFFLMGNDVR